VATLADIRELLARLNPTTIRHDTGSGGTGGLSNLDVAAALGFVPRGLGREVLIACHWPDGARLDRKHLLNYVLAAVRVEWERQGRELQDARTGLGLAEVCAGWHGTVTPEQRRGLEAARAHFERVRDQCWPKDLPAMLPVLTSVALAEIAKRNHCPDCQGRGETLAGSLRVPCAKCGGSGVLPVSERSRAESIGRHVESYRRHWAPVYNWLLALLTDAEQGAARDLADALRDSSVAG
jgi:hypothetical protein